MAISWWLAASAVLMAMASPANAQSADAAPADPALVRLIEDQAKAVVAFDQPTLAALTAPDYQEISPVGDVDARAAMLGFYAPENKVPAPTVAVSETSVRRIGDLALMTARITYTMVPPTGAAATSPPPTRALRGGYVARRYGTMWKLVSAQFTPIRTPPGSPPPH
ncbi:nuclear transport factor 2 family protein [Sphingomonas oligophenolica]|uniref:Nuclear transport factor 2 family protein n=1 Tax=Sphingomonas oligophenolica TaxID=301154 RepID=A0A502CC53_9SPHN|nr:nuclear transport factor 2 family protein [Sphingomonas oligophenolica]TPG10403.1 nuclear transport factor 2 family protein [Sphingomonas oligophenolica]